MKKIILIITIGLTFFACNEQKSETQKEEVKEEISLLEDSLQGKAIEIAPKQVYSINTLKDDTIIGLQGTKIIVPKNSFKSEGEIRNCIAVLREFYCIPDIIQSDLHTVSDKGLLQSKGMFYFNVYTDSSCLEPVELKNNVKLTCQIPTEVTNDYTLFYLDSINQETEWKEFKDINDTSILVEQYDTIVGIDVITGEEIPGTETIQKRSERKTSKSTIRMRSRSEYYFDKFGFINCDRYTGKMNEIYFANISNEYKYYAIANNSIAYLITLKEKKLMRLPINTSYTLVSYKELVGGFVSYSITTHFSGDTKVMLDETHVKVSKEEFNTILTNTFGNNMNV